MRYRTWMVVASLLGLSPVYAQGNMALSSNSVVDGKIAKVHGCPDMGGKDTSVHLQIDQIPAGSRYVSIVVDDPDARKPAGKVWVHWNLFNIPVNESRLTVREGQTPQGDVGRSSGNMRGFEGMCPPDGVHTYRFAVYATADKVAPASRPMTVEDTDAKLGGQALSKALMTGRY